MDYSFGNWVKRRRKSLDISQEELAQRVGCSASLIFKIEADERRPSRQIAELLVNHLEIPPDWRDMFLRVARHEKPLDYLDALPQPAPVESILFPKKVSPLTLPAHLTPLIGREHELNVILQQLQNPNFRLLTLTGLGGVGKTRLALDVAHHCQNSFNHGACFVSLVGTATPERVVPAIAEALDFAFSGMTDLLVQLCHYLKEKHILLVLDNLEHLLAGIQWIDVLLERAPNVKILATSREPLNLRSEWIFEIQGLPIPELEDSGIEASSAVALFLQRAQKMNLGFLPSSADRTAIRRISQLVEGLPLGLELAAGWVRTLSIMEIVREMEQSMDFLTSSVRDVPDRHRSLRAVFDHSWSLLSLEESSVLMKLSIFRGGFTRAAAEYVTGATLPVLSSLVDKSLVRRNGASRYDLHELIRQHAGKYLQAVEDENEAAHRRHATYYVTLLEGCEPGLRSRFQKETLTEIRPEMDNFRAAWDFAVASGAVALLRRATGPWFYFYELHQYFQEAEALYRRGAEMVRTRMGEFAAGSAGAQQAMLEGALGDMLTHQAYFLDRMGKNREALDLHRASIALLRPLDEPYALTFACVLYGSLCWATGDLQEAQAALQEGLALSTSLDHPWTQAVAYCFLGSVTHDLGEHDAAYQYFVEAITRCEQMQDPYLILMTGALFSRTAQALGRLNVSQKLLHENLKIASESGNRWGIGLGLEQLSANALAGGNPGEARRLLGESAAMYREIGDPWSLSRVLISLTHLALADSDLVNAEASAIEAFLVSHELAYNLSALEALAALAEIEYWRGQNRRALELALFVGNHPASAQAAKTHAERLRAEAEVLLAPGQIEEAKSRAQFINLDELARDFSG